MKRLAFAATLLIATSFVATGCRSCQSCHDYDSPVADCACASCTACGSGRAGSVLSGGYASETVYDAVPQEAIPYETVVE